MLEGENLAKWQVRDSISRQEGREKEKKTPHTLFSYPCLHRYNHMQKKMHTPMHAHECARAHTQTYTHVNGLLMGQWFALHDMFMLYNPTLLADDSPWQTWSGHFGRSGGISALEKKDFYKQHPCTSLSLWANFKSLTNTPTNSSTATTWAI